MRACVVMRAIRSAKQRCFGYMCRWSLIPVNRISLTGARSKPQSRSGDAFESRSDVAVLQSHALCACLSS